MILLRTDGSRGFHLFVSIFNINLLAGSHQPRACSYISRLTIASKKCPLSGSPFSLLSLLPSPHLPYNPSIAPPPDPVLHVTLSTLHPRLHTLHICHLHLRIASTCRKWGACQFRKAHRRKGNIFLLLVLVKNILIIMFYYKGTWYQPGSAHLLYLLVNWRINFILGMGNCGWESSASDSIVAIGKGLYDRTGGKYCGHVNFHLSFCCSPR